MEISWRLVGDLLEIKRKASAFMFIHRELMFAVREHVFVRRELMFIVREYNFQSPQTPCTSSFHPKHKITPPLQVACRYKRGSCPRRSIVSYINRSLADTNGAPALYSCSFGCKYTNYSRNLQILEQQMQKKLFLI